ncbi:MAG TPA: ABC transporter permease, partial [Cyclobacteriaceae bacterium]|nr:ABC transporter permease [Cyclobacteriaceae bacterium]
MKLTRNDVDFIRRELRRRGVVNEGLLGELVDHVACEVEREMKEGTPFRRACEKILTAVAPVEFPALQDKVIQSENYNMPVMVRNTWKIMLRNLRKHSSHAIINVAGLALGLTCFIVVVVYVKHELGYDTAFTKSSSLYRVTMSSTVGGTDNFIPTSYPTLGPEIQSRFPEVESFTRIFNYKYTRMIPTFRFDDRIFYEDKVIFADSNFFRLFDFPFVAGNPATALVHPNAVVLTESIARKYFGDADPLGKHLNFNGRSDVEVTGILKDLPSDTHLQFDFVIPMSNIGNSGAFRSVQVLDNWNVDWFWTYMVIPDPAAVPTVESGLNQIAADKVKDFQQEFNVKFYIQSLRDIHLHSHFDYNTDITANGDMGNLLIFVSVGILVLLISAINFINITMATASRRYREIGISKVLGALKSQLRMQFLFESVAVCLVSLVIAFFLLQLALPLFSNLMGVALKLGFLSDLPMIGGITLFTVLVGVLSGLYPAFFVSSLEPQRVLKGVWKPGQGGATFRKMLVGAQIVISIFLIIGTVVIWEQLRFIQNKSLGYDQDQIVMLPIRGTSL